MFAIQLDATLIGLIVAGCVTVIGAIVAGVSSIITLLRETKKKVEDTAATIDATQAKQLMKLNNITLLVDGRYGEVLQELAEVKMLLAMKTGLLSDKAKADQAQIKADDQQQRVAEAKGFTENAE